MTFQHFIGIDVSKDTLDFCVRNQSGILLSNVCTNNKKGVNSMIRKIRSIKDFKTEHALFCMEHTGIYNNCLIDFLSRLNAKIWLESALRIKQSQGMLRGKSDRVDAERIALYAYTYRDQTTFFKPQREAVVKLKKLIVARERIVKLIKQINVPLNENKLFATKDEIALERQLFKAPLNALKKQLLEVEKHIKRTIAEDEELKRVSNLIQSVNGIGLIISINIIVATNEFQSITDPQKFACYSGLAPFEHRSGTSIRGRSKVSNLANKKNKTLFHLAAMAAISKAGELQDYYHRKVQEGKNKMSVLNAVRNKLVRRIFAVVKRGTPYEKYYVNKFAV